MEINQNWVLRYTDPNGKKEEIAAKVPGNVLGDLQRAGKLPDLYYGCNTLLARPYEFIDWEYETRFTAPAVTGKEKLELKFNGVDTVADVFVNGKPAGHCENMFIEHVFDVTEIAKPGENTLVVKIASSVNYARKFRRPPMVGMASVEALFLRRPYHTYGWDICPRLVGAGLWRSVELNVVKPTRWTDVYTYAAEIQEKTPGNFRAEFVIDWNFETEEVSLDGFTAKFVMQCGDSKYEHEFIPRFVSGRQWFGLEKPKLWWPRSSGKPDMYDAELTLFHNGEVVDVLRRKIGVRDIRLLRTESLNDRKEGEFCFLVNGRRIFVRGSNWVPADALHGEEGDRIKNDLQLFADLNCNMVRCWGGNVYESEEFYSECDRLGLMVWQDFMFACAIPPQSQEFQDLIADEAATVIRRLRNHPCVALYSGDNEVDEVFFYGIASRRTPPSFNRITREVLPRQVALWDPARSFLPSSPFLSDECWKRKDRYSSPEQHLWGPRDSWKNPFYKDNCAIFASECGYHGLSTLSSIKKFIPPESVNGRVGNRDWVQHATEAWADLKGGCSYRIKLMEDQVANSFGKVPEKLEEYILCSQIVQAEAVKFMIENFRFSKHDWKKTGLIWWNVIDCWPQFSDAVVDYYGDKKLAYYYIRNAQQDVHLMFSEPASWCIRLNGANDTFEPVSGTYKISDLLTGEVEKEGDFYIPANDGAEIVWHRICQGVQKMLLIEWTCSDGRTGFNTYMQSPALLNLKDYYACLKKLEKRLGYDLAKYHVEG